MTYNLRKLRRKRDMQYTKSKHQKADKQRQKFLELKQSFLTTRHQRVLVDGEASDYTQVRSGVP